MSSKSLPVTSVVQESRPTSMSPSTFHLLPVSCSKDIYLLCLSGMTVVVLFISDIIIYYYIIYYMILYISDIILWNNIRTGVCLKSTITKHVCIFTFFDTISVLSIIFDSQTEFSIKSSATFCTVTSNP